MQGEEEGAICAPKSRQHKKVSAFDKMAMARCCPKGTYAYLHTPPTHTHTEAGV